MLNPVLNSLEYCQSKVWTVSVNNNFENNNFTLLISKMSEALDPDNPLNLKGAGGTFEDFIKSQKNVVLLVNAGFNHYRQQFYDWPHSKYKVGDPVGFVKIRHHIFKDWLEPTGYGFFVQKSKGDPWDIVTLNEVTLNLKYILGCTPLLIMDRAKMDISSLNMNPVGLGVINPPSYLGHGLARHPRTAVAIKGDHILFIIAEAPGLSLIELQNLGIALKVDKMLNLDGGGSSQFRLFENNTWIKNAVTVEDTHRVLGHVFALFKN